MRSKTLQRALLLCLLLSGLAASAMAGVTAPYTVDASTAHLYHFNGDANDAVTANAWNLSLLNGAVATTNTYAGLGTSLSTYSNPPISGSTLKAAMGLDGLLMSQMTGASGAFTMEAMINPQIDMASTVIPGAQMIISGDSAATTRAFQFRISKANLTTSMALTFIQINPTTVQTDGFIPSAGPNAYVPGAWYHVAVTYSGVPNVAGNLKLYWTRVDPSRTTADLLKATTMTTSISPACNVKFCIGNTGRTNPTAPFLGAIDEVRISTVERAATAMLFAAMPEIDVSPATVNFANVNPVLNPTGFTTASVTISNTGTAPLVFQTQTGEFKKGIKITGDNKVSIESVTPDTANPLAVGQSVKVVVKFLPTAAGYVAGGTSHDATLSIFTNDADEAQVDVPLHGLAVPVELSNFNAE